MAKGNKNVQRGEQRLEQIQRIRIAEVMVKTSELLSGSDDEANELIHKEAEDNPALEVDETSRADEMSSTQGDGEGSANDDDYGRDGDGSGFDNDYDHDDNDDDGYSPSGRGAGVLARADDTLFDTLLQQIAMSNLNDDQKRIACHIVGNLDDNGFFNGDSYEIIAELMAQEDIYVEEDDIEHVLKVVQDFEPAGIAARDIRECLLIQLAKRNTPYTPLATRMVSECCDEIIANRLDRVAAALDIDVAEVELVVKKEIRNLDPKPGGAYNNTGSGDKAMHVTPTFVVSVDEGNIEVEIPNTLPELHVSYSYEQALADFDKRDKLSKNDAQLKAEFVKNIDKAKTLIQALKMRQTTLKQTISAIIHFQREYFLSYGDITALKPMNLKDLEDITGRDSSILSRACSGKYVSTPWGNVRLKFFFSEGIVKKLPDGSEVEVANKEVMAALQELIDNEDKRNPLSDEQLTIKLNAMGYQLARRTVGKYRAESLNYPKASLRKTFV